MRHDHKHDGARPWRGVKRDNWEGGHRVPMVARWPGKIKAGSVTEHLSGFNDFMATAAQLAGASLKSATTDGTSYLATLLGKPEAQKKTEYRYYRWKNSRAVRVADWKLIHHKATRSKNKKNKKNKKDNKNEKNKNLKPESYELYDLTKDVGERNNITAKHPEVVKRLKLVLEKAEQPIG